MYIHPSVLEQLSQRYKADMQEQALASRRRGRASTGATSRVAGGWSFFTRRLRHRSRVRTAVLHTYARPWRSWRATAVPHD